MMRKTRFLDQTGSQCIEYTGVSRLRDLSAPLGAVHMMKGSLQRGTTAFESEKLFGRSLADTFDAPDYSCGTYGDDHSPKFAVTRLSSGPRDLEQAPAYRPDPALLVCVALIPTPVGQWQARYNGQQVGVASTRPFAVTVLDLQASMKMLVKGPFDYLHFYISKSFLKEIAADGGLSSDISFRARFFVEDLVIAQITKGILSEVKHQQPLSLLRLDQLSLILGAHLIQSYSSVQHMPVAPHKGLEAWQKLRSEELLRSRLNGNIAIAELASACQLSASHFARCFRLSYGVPVHRFLIRLRLEKAKELLVDTKSALSDIAMESGFFDQAALTKQFSQVERITPSKWRKINAVTHSPIVRRIDCA
jgi:AraC family transcriptional regulator